MAELVCPRCGHANPLGSNFCSSCGLALHQHPDDTATLLFPMEEGADEARAADPLPTTAVPAIEIDRPAMLVVTRGQNVGARISLSRLSMTVGRHPESDLFFDDITVSRRHAEIIFLPDDEGGAYEVHDVGSLNGTYLNRQRIERAVLRDGDELQIGKFKLAFYARATDA